MAITIESAPQDYVPVYSDIMYTVSSTNYAQTNFKFVAVVKNASGTTLAKLKAPILYGTTDKGVFNISRILRSYVTYDFTLNTLQPARCLNSYIGYSVEFGEEYGTTPTEYLNLTSSTGKYAWNGVYSVFANESIADYLCDDSSAKFLTTVRRRRVDLAQQDYLYFLSGLNTDVAVVEVKAYNASGTLLADSDISQSFDGSSIDEYLLRVAAGPANLNTIAQGQLVSGTAGSLVPANTAYYTIRLHDNATPPVTYLSEEYRFDVVEDCSKWSARYLYFLNRLGGFESVRFSQMNREMYDIERKQFKRNNYTLSGNEFIRDSAKHGMTNYNVEKRKKVVLHTDFLNETEWEWLHDLMSSPVVFLDGTIPVNIVDTRHEVFTLRDAPQFLRVEVEYTEPERLQNV